MIKANFFEWKRKLMSMLLLLLVFSLSGCWSAKEIHGIALINAIGIDLNQEGDFEVTSIIVKPSALFSQTATGGTEEGQQNKYLVKRATGKTISEAMAKISKSTAERMYFGHVEVVIFGEQAAREKLESSLDFFNRESEYRPNIQLLVVKGRVSDVINIPPEFNTTLGLEVMDLVTSNRYIATKMVKDISQFNKVFSSNTTDSVTGALTASEKITMKNEGQGQESKNNNETKPQVISLDGTAVFKGKKLIGFLNEKETRGFLWLKGELRNEIIVLDCGKYDPGKVSVVIRENDSQFKPDINRKSMKMTINTNLEAHVNEVTCSNLNLDSKKFDYLNKKLEEKVTEEANSVLNKAQKQWQTDIFGFGEAIYRKEPKEWDQIVSDWRNGGLKKMKIDLSVKANISRYGLRKDPSQANESR